MSTEEKSLTPVDRLKSVLKAESVQEQFQNALRDNRDQFIASLIDVYSTDRYLQECDPKRVVMEALKAATLKLPINKALGFAWIVPYKKVPQFQIGYKGYVQLAMRAGQYKYLNADLVYEGELVSTDKLTGEMDLSGKRTTDKVLGYFAHIATINGFRKTVYWTTEQVQDHAKKFSKAYHLDTSAWQTNFDAMALKTLLRHLLSHYGVLSVEMMNAIAVDRDEEAEFAEEVSQNANGEVIDVEVTVIDSPPPPPEPPKGKKTEEPDF